GRRLHSGLGRSTHLVYFAGHGDDANELNTLRAVCSSPWLHAQSLYERLFYIRKKKLPEPPLLFMNSCVAGDSCSLSFELSFVRHLTARLTRTQSDYLSAHAECTSALIEALTGSAAGREGLVTISDIERYLNRRLKDPDVLRRTGKLQVRARFSNE